MSISIAFEQIPGLEMPSAEDIRRYNFVTASEILNEIKNGHSEMIERALHLKIFNKSVRAIEWTKKRMILHSIHFLQQQSNDRCVVDEHSNFTNDRPDHSDTSSVNSGIDASIADHPPRQIGESSYWEYIVDPKSIKMRRQTPIVRRLRQILTVLDSHSFLFFHFS